MSGLVAAFALAAKPITFALPAFRAAATCISVANHEPPIAGSVPLGTVVRRIVGWPFTGTSRITESPANVILRPTAPAPVCWFAGAGDPSAR